MLLLPHVRNGVAMTKDEVHLDSNKQIKQYQVILISMIERERGLHSGSLAMKTTLTTNNTHSGFWRAKVTAMYGKTTTEPENRRTTCNPNCTRRTLLVLPHLSGPNMTMYGVSESSCSGLNFGVDSSTFR